MPRIKVGDLHNVTDLATPMIVKATGHRRPVYSTRDEQPIVLHISDKHGNHEREVLRVSITRCNRALASTWIVDELPEDASPTWLRPTKLCARCGTSQDFENALAQYWEWRRAQEAEFEAAEKDAARQKEQEALERSERLFALSASLWDMVYPESGGKVEPIGEPVHGLKFAFGGYVYEVYEGAKVDEQDDN